MRVVWCVVLLILALVAAQARADQYVVVETSTGHVINRIIASSDFTPGAGLALAADVGQQIYVAPQPAATTLSAEAFLQRFTRLERQNLNSFDPAWGLEIASADTIDTTNSELRTQIAMAVASGALSQTRADQVLDLSRSSP